MLYHFHVVLFPCCTFFILHIFHFALCSFCTLFMYCTISCSTFTYCNVSVAFFPRCTLTTLHFLHVVPVGIYMSKVNNRNTRARCEICSKLTIKTPDVFFSGVFFVNFEHVSHLALVFLLLTLSKQMPSGALFSEV